MPTAEFRRVPLPEPSARGGFWPGLVLLSLVLSCAHALAAPQGSGPESVVGAWEIVLEGSNRKCRLTLRSDATDPGSRAVGIPAMCRRALPVLATVEGWSLTGDSALELSDTTGLTVLDFGRADGGGFTADGPGGETYRLVAVPGVARRAEAVQPAPQAEPAAAPRRSSDVAAPSRSSDVAGRYAILREGGKDTGCMLTLDDKAKGRGGDKATLAPACRDQGIVIFDPVGWQIIAGRLVLTARKGHSTHLDRQADGTWLKDPKEGKSLSLKKL